MISTGNNSWTLDLNFIRGGSAKIKSPLNGREESVRWTIATIPANGLPISLVECRIEGMGHAACGYGDSVLYTNSLTQAFAEAWERLWLEIIRKEPTPAGRRIHSSNGFACGPTAEEAETRARGELIERAIFLKAWDTRRGWSRVSRTGALNHILVSCLESSGWRATLYQIEEARLGRVICGLALRPQGGAIFDCCYPAGRNLGTPQNKVLRSLLRAALIQRRQPAAYERLPEQGRPESHFKFYLNPEHFAAFEFLKKQAAADSPLELGGYDDITTRLQVDILGFPYVAAATNPRWPELRWGNQSIHAGGNEWPHPLA